MPVIGIGSIPDAVLSLLKNHKDLGIHSEMISDGVVDLAEAGCLSNSQKKIFPGKIVSSFCLGSRRLYNFLDNNPSVGMIPIFVTYLPAFHFNENSLYINLSSSYGRCFMGQ